MQPSPPRSPRSPQQSPRSAQYSPRVPPLSARSLSSPRRPFVLQRSPREEMLHDAIMAAFDIRPPMTTRGTRSPRPDLVLEKFRNTSKMHAKLDESYFPEEIMAVRHHGYMMAHARRVQTMQSMFDKQWYDQQRLRRRDLQRMNSLLSPVRHQRDNQTLERVIQDREERKMAKREPMMRQPRLVRIALNRNEKLPPEERAFDRRLFYH